MAITFAETLKQLTDAFAPLQQVITASLNPLTAFRTTMAGIAAQTRQAGAEIGKSLGTAIGGSIGAAVGGPIGAILGTALGDVIKSLADPIGVLKSSIAPFVGFVEKLNPALLIQLNQAFDDLMAVIGRGLTPIINAFTSVIRYFGDAMVSLTPIIRQVSTIFAGFLKEFGKDFVDVFSVWLTGMAQILVLVQEPMRFVLGLFTSLIKTLRELGLIPEFKPNSSTGAAFRGAGFTGIEDVAKSAQTAAFSVGGKEEDVAKVQLLVLQEIVDAINEWGQAIWDKIPTKEEAKEKINENIEGKTTGGKVGRFILDPTGLGRRALVGLNDAW